MECKDMESCKFERCERTMTQGKPHANPALVSLSPGCPFWSQDKSKCNWWRKMPKTYIFHRIFTVKIQHIYCTPGTPFCPRVGVVGIIMLISQVQVALKQWAMLSLSIWATMTFLIFYLIVYYLLFSLLSTNTDPDLYTLHPTCSSTSIPV